MTKYIIITIAVLILFIILFITAYKGMEKQERYECMTWLEQSSQYAGWYATGWQVEQCQAHGIELD